jgi:hypothetical protein
MITRMPAGLDEFDYSSCPVPVPIEHMEGAVPLSARSLALGRSCCTSYPFTRDCFPNAHETMHLHLYLGKRLIRIQCSHS